MSHNLNFTHNRTFDINLFQKPKAVGFFSIMDANRKYSDGAENLKYIYLKYDNPVNLNLNAGIDTFIGKTEVMENDVKLDSILHWILTKNMLTQLLQEDNIITWRGVLSMLMKTPYERQEDWLLCATKVNNVIFLCPFYTLEKKKKVQTGGYPNEKSFTYWGYKFEQYMLTDRPDSTPNLTEDINANLEFCILYRNKLNSHNLLYGAEVDGVVSPVYINDKPEEILKAKFVELKTSRKMDTPNQERNFKRFKLLKFWSQSFLVDIERIICGFRNDSGNVLRLKTYHTKEIPNTVDGMWSSRVCVGFLNEFLQFVKDTLKDEADFTVWRFDWSAGSTEISARRNDDKEHSILPESFINECKRCQKGL